MLLDAPVILEGEGMEASWRPENSCGDFHGPTRLREALVRSRNLVSIRLLRSLGTATAIDYITHFGFQRNALPNNLTLVLDTTAGDPAADRIGLCHIRQWRLSRAAVFHRSH